MTGCSAPNCSNSTTNGYHLYRIPKDPIRRNKWVVNSGRVNWTPTTYTCFCESHFEESQFELGRADGNRKLRWNAIPTLFNLNGYPTSRRGIKKISNRELLVLPETVKQEMAPEQNLQQLRIELSRETVTPPTNKQKRTGTTESPSLKTSKRMRKAGVTAIYLNSGDDLPVVSSAVEVSEEELQGRLLKNNRKVKRDRRKRHVVAVQNTVQECSSSADCSGRLIASEDGEMLEEDSADIVVCELKYSPKIAGEGSTRLSSESEVSCLVQSPTTSVSYLTGAEHFLSNSIHSSLSIVGKRFEEDTDGSQAPCGCQSRSDNFSSTTMIPCSSAGNEELVQLKNQVQNLSKQVEKLQSSTDRLSSIVQCVINSGLLQLLHLKPKTSDIHGPCSEI